MRKNFFGYYFTIWNVGYILTHRKLIICFAQKCPCIVTFELKSKSDYRFSTFWDFFVLRFRLGWVMLYLIFVFLSHSLMSGFTSWFSGFTSFNSKMRGFFQILKEGRVKWRKLKKWEWKSGKSKKWEFLKRRFTKNISS